MEQGATGSQILSTFKSYISSDKQLQRGSQREQLLLQLRCTLLPTHPCLQSPALPIPLSFDPLRWSSLNITLNTAREDKESGSQRLRKISVRKTYADDDIDGLVVCIVTRKFEINIYILFSFVIIHKIKNWSYILMIIM